MDSMASYTISKKSFRYLAMISGAREWLDSEDGPQRNFAIQEETRDRSLYLPTKSERTLTVFDKISGTVDNDIAALESTRLKESDNIYTAYDKIMSFDPYSVDDLLKAHELMMDGLIDNTGTFRTKKVKIVYDGELIHYGVRPELIPALLEETLACLQRSDLHPLYKSGIMHLELGKIHPFPDGNGRMGRLWQSLILAQWDERFRQVPLESVISQRKDRYYKAVKRAWKKEKPIKFVEFTFEALYEAMLEQIDDFDEKLPTLLS